MNKLIWGHCYLYCPPFFKFSLYNINRTHWNFILWFATQGRIWGLTQRGRKDFRTSRRCVQTLPLAILSLKKEQACCKFLWKLWSRPGSNPSGPLTGTVPSPTTAMKELFSVWPASVILGLLHELCLTCTPLGSPGGGERVLAGYLLWLHGSYCLELATSPGTHNDLWKIINQL